MRQAHPRLRARLRPWRSPLALAFVAGVCLLSLLPLPTAFGAAPAERGAVAAAERGGGAAPAEPRAVAAAERPVVAATEHAPTSPAGPATAPSADRPSAPSTQDHGRPVAPPDAVAAIDAGPAAGGSAAAAGADASRAGPNTSGPTGRVRPDAATRGGRGIASPPARASTASKPVGSANAARTANAGSAAPHAPVGAGARASAVVGPPPTLVRGSLAGTRAVAGFLGDSYTTGWAGAGIGAAGWPALVSAALGLGTSNAAVAGSGFVNPGWTGQPVASRLATIVRTHPRIVFVAAGHNDRRFGASAASRAADVVLTRLRAALPTSVIVVVGPIWQDGRPPASLVGLRDHLRATAGRVGAVFIDPLAGGWFAGADHALIGRDGIHPTAAGHRRIAALVLEALRARGIVAASLRGR